MLTLPVPDASTSESASNEFLHTSGFKTDELIDEPAIYPSGFDPSPTERVLLAMQRAVAEGLRPILQKELDVARRDRVIKKMPEQEFLVRCGAPHVVFWVVCTDSY